MRPAGFTRDDVRRHLEAADGLRASLRHLVAESAFRDVEGTLNMATARRMDQELRDMIAWHESMAKRLEALLQAELPTLRPG